MTTGDRLNRSYLIQGFGLYLFILTAAALVDYFSSYPNPLSRIHLPPLSGMDFTMPVGIIVSATAQELLFRGYILQGLGLLTRNRILLALVVGFLFMMGHVTNAGSTFNVLLLDFEGGFFLTITTLKSNGLELAIGIHVAHNLLAGLMYWSARYEPVYLTILFPICAVIMYLVIFRRKAIAYRESATSEE
jgi:membrane protease YdiL (CAAX protease family)